MSGGDYNEVARSSSKYSVEGDGGKPAADAAMEGGIEDTGRNAVHFCTRLFEKNRYVVSLMTFLTLVSLFGDDLRLAVCPQSVDMLFYIFTVTVAVAFLAELIVLSIFKSGYFLSFFFWLDFLSVLSTIPDIPWVYSAVMIALTGRDSNMSFGNVEVARAGKASQVSAKAGRILRLMRLGRTSRTVANLKVEILQGEDETEDYEDVSISVDHFADDVAKSQHKKGADPAIALAEETDEGAVVARKGPKGKKVKSLSSAIGLSINEFTSKVVIVGVFVLMIAFPILTYSEVDNSKVYAMASLQANYVGTIPTDLATKNALKDNYLTESGVDLLYYSVLGTVYKNNAERLNQLRKEELLYMEYIDPTNKANISISQFDYSNQAHIDAAFSILLTFFMTFLLLVSSALFSKDANELVVAPIEKMIKWVKAMTLNPLGKTRPPAGGGDYEITLLTKTLTTLCSLLQIGFGDAGGKIIAGNLQGTPLEVLCAEGTKTYCVFGFCDIRKFEKMTEGLQEDVMLFVNTVAGIVHSQVHYHRGHANKNIGNAFLVVWKFPQLAEHDRGGGVNFNGGVREGENSVVESKHIPEDEYHADMTLSQKTHKKKEVAIENTWKKICMNTNEASIQLMCDHALLAYLTTQVMIEVDASLSGFKDRIMKSCGGVDLHMGFGLHIGWGVEGAVGSTYKMDASYLSPNVNITARLEVATKQYGVYILLSGAFVSMLHPELRSRCRRLDCVTVKGSKQPIDMYTFDISPMAMENARKCVAYLQKKKDRVRASVLASMDKKGVPELGIRNRKGGSGDVEMGSRGASARSSELEETKYSEKELNEIKHGSVILKRLNLKHTSAGENMGFDLEIDKKLVDKGILLQKGLPAQFVAKFNMASEAYVEGQWPTAKLHLEECQQLVPGDKPAEVLLGIMGETNFQAPPNWPGFRALTKK